MKKICSIILIFVSVSFLSCELEEANISENAPTNVSLAVLLPTAQVRSAAAMISEANPIASIFMQHLEGKASTTYTILNNYSVDPAYYCQDVFAEHYAAMNTLKDMINRATDSKSPHYSGVAKILMAMNLTNLSSMYGDVPHSKAFQGASANQDLNPVYDTQESIYATAQTLLDEAIAELSSPTSTFTPSLSDVILSQPNESAWKTSSIPKWKKIAYALKARCYLHVIKKQSNMSTAADNILNQINSAFTGTADDLQYLYGFSSGENNPYKTGKNSTDLLINSGFFTKISSDPRFLYYTFGSQGKGVGVYYGSATSPLPMITYYEMMFIKAECLLRSTNGSVALAQAALQEGVKANILKVTGTPAQQSYLDANATLSTTNTFEKNLEIVIKQKYLAMFLQMETWTDYRRTGYPVLTPNPAGNHNQNPGGAIPRRMPYPQRETQSNTNCPGVVDLQTRFWWDK